MSWKPEVVVDGKWLKNSLVFATKEEAEASARSLSLRWSEVRGFRAVESDEKVNYKIINGALEMVVVP